MIITPILTGQINENHFHNLCQKQFIQLNSASRSQRTYPSNTTRKAVAVIISETDYQNLTPKPSNLFKAISDWHKHLPNPNEDLIGDTEIRQWRETSQGRNFTWED